MCKNGKGPVQIRMTSDIVSVSSVQIKFKYRIGFSKYRNIDLTGTEEIGFIISLGSYMGASSPQDKLLLRSINTYLLELD